MTNSDTNPPYIPQELLEWLEGIYPLKPSTLIDTIDKIRYESGQQSVIEFIRMTLEEQNNPENLLDS